MKEELKYRPLEEVEDIVNFMNTTSKANLQALRVIDRGKTITETRKVISKHDHFKNVQKENQFYSQ